MPPYQMKEPQGRHIRRGSDSTWVTSLDFGHPSPSIRSVDSDEFSDFNSGIHANLNSAFYDIPEYENYYIMSWNDGNNGGGAAAAADPWGAAPAGDTFAAAGNDDFNTAPAHEAGGTNEYDDHGNGDDGQANGFDGGGGDRACFGCGQPGHNKADCPDKAPMTCRICGDPDHLRKDCPQKPAETCRNCKEEGHEVAECTNPRKIDYSVYPDMTDTEAWDAIVEAVSDRDAIEVKTALMAYLKHHPDLTYLEVEQAFRRQNMKVYIIGLEREIIPTMTLMDLQGNLGKKYYASFRFSEKASRPREFEAWPKTPEENLERLADAGEAVNNFIPRCFNCGELGHITKACEAPKEERAAVTVHCYNCDEDGHRVRDCPIPRKDRFACRNCGQSGHKSNECTEPRNADNVECNKCHEMGHFSRDCPQGGGGRACHNCGGDGHISRDCPEPRKLKCRNCDEEGHQARECPKPVDVSRIKCNNCGEMGHKQYQCSAPKQEDEYDNGGHGEADGFNAAPNVEPVGGGGDW